jgi:hypothetical protein
MDLQSSDVEKCLATHSHARLSESPSHTLHATHRATHTLLCSGSTRHRAMLLSVATQIEVRATEAFQSHTRTHEAWRTTFSRCYSTCLVSIRPCRPRMSRE